MTEHTDLVDKTGTVRKVGVPRHTVDNHPGLHMQIVIAIIFDPLGRVLVQQRALGKKVCPGSMDHVCGGVHSGETPEQAALREALEETGVSPKNLRVIEQGLNEYNRFRHLLRGESDTEPSVSNPQEVMWVGYEYPAELLRQYASGERTFVDGFFEDIARAASA